MKIQRLLLVSALLLFLATDSFAQSQNFGSITYGKAVNISGKQRMLSQKISKSYLLLAKGINDAQIKKELNSSKFIFAKQLQILTQNSTTSAVKLSFKNVNNLWTQFKTLINTTPDYQNSSRIMKLNTALLKACNEAVTSIENNFNYNNQFFKSKNKELVNTINISGKQRMLSQRLCLYYTASSMFPSENSEYKKVLRSVFNEFDTVIGNLLISSYNSSEIEEELGSVMSVWEKFQMNQAGLFNGDFTLEEVYNTTNSLTASFNKITGLYEAISDN